jgi:hypothetical protein
MPGILDGGRRATAEAAAWLSRTFTHG